MTGPVNHIVDKNFEKLYLQLREKEGRLYTDEQVRELPGISDKHPYYGEWQLRKASMQKLLAYLEKKKTSLNILEVGCGNGWLSHHLATLPNSDVTASDINLTEIQQAARVFANISNLHFIYGHTVEETVWKKRFDIVIFAASIQYFESLDGIIQKTFRLLKPGGEIHIIDSHFYPITGISAARERSLTHYENMGVPEMAEWYFHHNIEVLDEFYYTMLYDPNSLFNYFLRNKNPFPWIMIKE